MDSAEYRNIIDKETDLLYAHWLNFYNKRLASTAHDKPAATVLCNGVAIEFLEYTKHTNINTHNLGAVLLSIFEFATYLVEQGVDIKNLTDCNCKDRLSNNN